ncbi:MAG: hypothetical protein ACK4N5_10300 [Myxococcales bacterium]
MAILGLHAHRCPHCSAPLRVDRTAVDVTCEYCSHVIHVERAAPPADPARVKRDTVYVPTTISAVVVLLIVLGAGLPLLGVVVGVGRVAVKHLAPASLPAQCPPNGELLVEGREWSGAGVAVTAEANCKVTLRHVRLTADVGVRGAANVTVVLEDSRIEARDTAVALGVNGRVQATRTHLAGEKIGVRGDTNLHLELQAGEIVGERAVVGSSNARLSLAGSTLRGRRAGVEAESNLKLKLEGGAIHASDGVAIRGGTNVEVKGPGGVVEGSRGGIRAEGNLVVELTGQARVTGPIAIHAESNPRLHLDGATVEGAETGLRGESNVRVLLEGGALLAGGRVGLEGDSNLELTIEGATLKSGGTALKAGHNLRLEARRGRLEGRVVWELAGRASKLAIDEETVVTGEQRDRERTRPVAVAHVERPPAAPHTTAAPAPAGPAPFDEAATRAMLKQRALAAGNACRSIRSGWVHANVNVTFRPDGESAGLEFLHPKKLEEDKRACLVKALGELRVRPFDAAAGQVTVMVTVPL